MNSVLLQLTVQALTRLPIKITGFPRPDDNAMSPGSPGRSTISPLRDAIFQTAIMLA